MRKLMALCLSAAAIFAAQTATATPPLSEKGWQDKLETAKQRGYDFLKTRRGENSFSAGEEFKTKRIFADEEGLAHLHVQQTIAGVPVFGAEAIVHFDKNDAIAAFTDHLKEDSSLVNVIPSFDDNLAVNLATDV